MITVAEVQRAVAEHYRLPVATMTMRDRACSRAPMFSHPRQLAMTLCRELVFRPVSSGRQGHCISLPQIGKRFGHRDHTTVLHAIRQVEMRRKVDSATRRAIRQVTLDLVRR